VIEAPPLPLTIAPVDLGVNRYKATVAQVAPARLRDQLARGQRPLLGISLGSKNMQGAHLEACLKWLSENFDRYGVLVGDSVYRLTLEITADLSPDEAMMEALRMGREFAEMYRPLFAQYSRPGQCQVLHLSEVVQIPEFDHYHAQLQQLYDQDVDFQALVHQFAELYLGRGDKLIEESADERARKVALAVTYLLEESAAMALLQAAGWPILVYPGSINTFVDIAEGKLPAAPEPLKSLIFVELRLKRQGIYFPDHTSKQIQRRGTLANDEVALYAETAQNYELLADLSEPDWERFLGFAELRQYEPREVIIEHKQMERNLCILARGRVEVLLPDLHGKTKKQIRIIEEGSVFGEQSFLDGGPRTAIIMAITPCQVYLLSYHRFCQMAQDAPDLAIKLLLDIGRVQSIRSRQATEEMRAAV
jgi:tRNA-dependent cyclodipeptide synthase